MSETAWVHVYGKDPTPLRKVVVEWMPPVTHLEVQHNLRTTDLHITLWSPGPEPGYWHPEPDNKVFQVDEKSAFFLRHAPERYKRIWRVVIVG